MSVLLFAPRWAADPATSFWCPYVSVWLKKQLEGKVSVTLLEKDDCTRSKTKDAMKSCKMLTGAGHGNDDVFTGQYYQVIYKVGDDIRELKDKCFAPVSCRVGAKLLPWMIDNGVACGLGQIDDYTFVANPYVEHKGEDPNEDIYIKPFIMAEYTFVLSLADGKTAGEAYDDMINAYYRFAEEYRNIDPYVTLYLLVDAENRKFFGDKGWRLVEQPPQPPPPPPPQPPPPPPQPQCKYKCPWCGMETDDQAVMKQHIVVEHVYHRCPRCGAEYKTEGELILHYIQEHLTPCKLRKWIRDKLGCPLP
ncbi:MAG: hypothetical protein QW320_09820 [Ignisphaera sp.]